ncbi:MAG: DNA adenine methylase [Burkholderiales bacterium]|nr:DNA adenine methylase [Burkholderiales bacterium]
MNNIEMIVINAKPFLKWAGGKSQILREIEKFYPERIEKYCEPFVGGGAVLFDILAKFQPKEVLINDINPELTNTYYQIKNNVEDVIYILEFLQNEYLFGNQEERKSFFLEKRKRFNELIKNTTDKAEKAALMIYLNKTCFNGLYRVNSKGFYNVPSGVYKNPLICDHKNLRAVSAVLQSVQIKTGSYQQTQNFIDDKTFVYIDPPYRPLTESASFTAYSKDGFDDEKQVELSNFVSKIHGKGAKVLVSNSDPKNSNKDDNFFDDLYRNFDIYRVQASRMINSNASGRGAITELMITCF